MSFFWPTELNDDVGPLGRLGRVLHWLCLVIAALLAWAAVGSLNNVHDDWTAYAVFGLAFTMAGRGLRYILAGE